MSLISLQNSSELEVTILSNRFIDNFMPRANGEFVKVYIYLLRAVSSSPSSFSLEHMADRLFCTERDISRALKYWEGEKMTLINLYHRPDSFPESLYWNLLRMPVIWRAALPVRTFSTAGTSSSPVSTQMAACISQPVALRFSPKNVSLSSSNLPFPAVLLQNFHLCDYIRSLTPDRISELKQKRRDQSASLYRRTVSGQDTDSYRNAEDSFLL